MLLLGLADPSMSAEIRGKISLLGGWAPVIYLSQLNSFDDLNTASYHLLIAEADIDHDGYFHFDSINIPAYDQLYRLHICKKEDPVSTIIIGGQEQNHLHFLMNASSKLNAEIQSFHEYRLSGHEGNSTLQELFNLKGQINAPLDIPSDQNRRLHKLHIRDRFVRIAEEAQSDVNKLLAVHLLQKSFSLDEYANLYETLPNQLSDSGETSPYHQDFLEQVQYYEYSLQGKDQPTRSSIPWYYWLVIPVGIFISYYVLSVKKNNQPIDIAGILSIQEKKVYDLLRTGKSNKEISTELHIEVSTVKSHVYKIFSKLGIKSRRELFQ